MSLHPRHSDDLAAAADRVRRLYMGETYIVDLRSETDPAAAAAKAIDTLAAQCREPDEFVLNAHQEAALGVRLGSLKTLFGYPVKVVYEFDED